MRHQRMHEKPAHRLKRGRCVTCRDFVEFLSEYLSGELAEVGGAEFEAHLAECPACVAYLGLPGTLTQAGPSCWSPEPRPTLSGSERAVAGGQSPERGREVCSRSHGFPQRGCRDKARRRDPGALGGHRARRLHTAGPPVQAPAPGSGRGHLRVRRGVQLLRDLLRGGIGIAAGRVLFENCYSWRIPDEHPSNFANWPRSS
jgi:anti-sigma factor RsiW